jgi:hypothetical protein
MTHLFTATSGIHIEPFYKQHYLPSYNITERYCDDLDILISDEVIRKEMKNHSVKDYDNDRECFYDSIRNNMQDDALMYNYAYEPRRYNEDIAYLCNLIPFTIRSYDGNLDVDLLSFGGAGMDMTYKLEAYQLLSDHSYDERSNFAEKGISYFEYYYGRNSKVVKEIKKIMGNNRIAA